MSKGQREETLSKATTLILLNGARQFGQTGPSPGLPLTASTQQLNGHSLGDWNRESGI